MPIELRQPKNLCRRRVSFSCNLPSGGRRWPNGLDSMKKRCAEMCEYLDGDGSPATTSCAISGFLKLAIDPGESSERALL